MSISMSILILTIYSQLFQKSHSFYKKKIEKFELDHHKRIYDGCSSTLELFL